VEVIEEENDEIDVTPKNHPIQNKTDTNRSPSPSDNSSQVINMI